MGVFPSILRLNLIKGNIIILIETNWLDMMVECPNLTINLKTCMCTSTDCERKGTCCECVRNHKSNGNLPACLRPPE
jgi:hypothetical protein